MANTIEDDCSGQQYKNQTIMTLASNEYINPLNPIRSAILIALVLCGFQPLSEIEKKRIDWK